MAITAKPTRPPAAALQPDARQVNDFIATGGSAPGHSTRKGGQPSGRVPVLTRLPAALLAQVDAAAAQQFATRTGFVIAALVEKLERDGTA